MARLGRSFRYKHLIEDQKKQKQKQKKKQKFHASNTKYFRKKTLLVAPQIFVFTSKALKEFSGHFLLISRTKCHEI